MQKIKIIALSALIICCSANAQEGSKVLIFSKTEGYRHQSIEDGVRAMKQLGKENNFVVDATEDSDVFVADLKKYKAVIFLNTTGDIFNKNQQKAFKKYIHKGGGYVGIHAATDTEYDWSWYGKMVGAYFMDHPQQQKASINVVDKKHLSTEFLGATWVKFDEWYNYKEINNNINVLMELDESSYSGGKNGKNHPIAWYHKYDGGRIFYTGLGHTKESYTNTTFLKHILGGIKYAIGKSK